jgi:choline dehydrogenase-like flavoprotein
LRLHPTSAIVAEYGDPVEMWKGPMQTIVVRKHQSESPGGHGPWLEAVPAHPGLSALAFPWTSRKAHQERMSRLRWAAATIVLVRDTGAGRVRVDARGEPVLDYRLTAEDRQNLTNGFGWAARIHQAAGAVRLFSLHAEPVAVGDGTRPLNSADVDEFAAQVARRGVVANAVSLFSAHPLGSARSGKDPRTSTAGPTGECHGIRGLWVGDGSILPTAPGVNPMVSILAVAERTANFVLAASGTRGG